jgi:hypothetical protein
MLSAETLEDAGGLDCAAGMLCRAALKLVPHSSFTFAKLWLLAAKLEVRPDAAGLLQWDTSL